MNYLKQLIKTILLVWFSGSLSIISLNAQTEPQAPCYFDEYTNNKSILKTETAIQASVERLKNNLMNNPLADSSKVIPVVVHVIHNGGSENISDEQVESQINILNEDFGKIPGSNGDGNGVDTKVRFCLARIDPNGNCTNGIVRINSLLTYHQTYERAMLTQLSFWDNTKYLNIYLVKTITGGILGYSSFPGGPPAEDGIVVRSNVFGNTGTASSSLGRTTTHEVGHWFGLYHTFNNGCGDDVCFDGDYVCDTPPQASPSFSCTTLNTCSNDVPDENDQKENYMNYTPGACKDMFTNGQKLRVQATLDTIRTFIWSDDNLVSTGCDTNYIAPEICGVAANFVTLTPDICIGNEVGFMDISLNVATSWQWFFVGGTPESSTLPNPSITYNSIGSFAVKLIVSDGTTTDSLAINDYITVSNPGVGNALPFSEYFDSGIFPPQGIIINNPDGGITWGLDSAASVSGGYSIKINNLININYGSADEIIFPYFDLTSMLEPTMTFKWAYARSDPSFSDEMLVLLSTDCGSNFTQIFYRTGNALATGPTQTTPFIPDSSQWKSAEIPLANYASDQYVQIKIVNITDGGNNLYIDNIDIGSLVTGLEDTDDPGDIALYPNPASDYVMLRFTDNTENRQVKIFDPVGKLVLSKDIGNALTIRLSLNDFPNGIYYLGIWKNNSMKMKKLVISR
ncbi:MAG: T9SS type A sorting domain-containing protein [Chlorobi bacterium]|nr:T9SS type A sorting domain-containing protein [Chlorobiota bacterium]